MLQKKKFYSQWFKSIAQRGGGGAVMVWVCFQSSSAGPPCTILDSKFNLAKYLEMLSNIAELFFSRKYASNWIYQQDNSAVYTAPSYQKVVQKPQFQSIRLVAAVTRLVAHRKPLRNHQKTVEAHKVQKSR